MKESKGITLIALVITIIVLLILAAVTINSLNGDNGIVANAKNSADTHTTAKEEETIRLALEEWQIKSYMKSNTELDFGDFMSYKLVGTILSSADYLEEDSDEEHGTYVLMQTKSGNIFAASANGEIMQFNEGDFDDDDDDDTEIIHKTWAERGITNVILDTQYYRDFTEHDVTTRFYYIFKNGEDGGYWEENVYKGEKTVSANDIDTTVQRGHGAYYGYGEDATEQAKTNYFRSEGYILVFNGTELDVYYSVSDYEAGINADVYKTSW